MSDLYIVLIVALIAWGGIFLYLLRLDLRVGKLEKKDEK
ncbi:MAG TPA: CcmD family protein [Firmicutes bacterium]|nr:CcmD family protein [Bacillota bacterium]